MTSYEKGFTDGERKCFDDRRAGKPLRVRPDDEFSEYGRGFWDGYTPRSMTWALNKTPVRAYTETEAA